MPGYRAHLVGGVIAFIGFFSLMQPRLDWFFIGELFLITCFGSLFPDIDIKSRGQRLFYTLLCAVLFFLLFKKYYIVSSFLGLISLYPLIVPHRGPLHNPYLLVGITGVATAVIAYGLKISSKFLLWHSLFFLVGVMSHLVLDYGIKKFFKKLFKFR